MESKLVAKLSTLVGILGAVISLGVWVFGYHDTLSTKKEVNLIYIELRLKDVQDSVFYYSQRDTSTLNNFEKARQTRLQATLLRLEGERDKPLGLAQ